MYGSRDTDHPIFAKNSASREAEHLYDDKMALLANDVLVAIQEAKEIGDDLRVHVDEIVQTSSWTEKLAESLLDQLAKGLRNEMKMGGALKDAFNKAVAAATKFARDHPAYCTLIALGILVILLPWVIEALGFGELGPIEGT
jgi:hypothetical protein